METMISCSEVCKHQINGVCCYNTTLVDRAYNNYCVSNNSCSKKSEKDE